MMSKRKLMGVVTAVLVLAVLTFAIFASGWGDLVAHSGPVSLPTFEPMVGETLLKGSLSYMVFEVYGPIVALLSLIMFGAMVGAICVAREEVDDDDSD